MFTIIVPFVVLNTVPFNVTLNVLIAAAVSAFAAVMLNPASATAYGLNPVPLLYNSAT